MLYTVTLYLVYIFNTGHIRVTKYENYGIISTIPIVQCTGNTVSVGSQISKETGIYHVCETEKLYAAMTGQETIEILVTGKYNI